MNIVLAGNKNFIKQLNVVICSCDKFNKDCNYYVLSNDLNKEDFLITKKLEIIRISDNLIKDVKIPKQYIIDYSIASFYRVLIYKLLYFDKCIYLDGDTLVCDNISSIYNINDNILFNGVIELIRPIQLTYGPLFSYMKTIEEFNCFYKKCTYFNDGVLTMNLKLMNDINYIDSIINLSKKYQTQTFIQDFENIIALKYGVNFMDYSFNIMPFDFYQNVDFNNLKNSIYTKDVILNSINNPKIIHFAGKPKPWETNLNVLFYNKWREFCNEIYV